MKHKFKNYLKLGILLFGISTILTNCQDKHFVEENLKSGISVKRITTAEIENNKAVLTELVKFNNVKAQKNSTQQSRGIYNSDYDFTIETDEALYVEYEDYHSYTFKITRANESDVLENLLLSLQNDNSYKAYIVSYDVTQEEREILSIDNTFDLLGKVSFRNIEFDTSFLQTSRDIISVLGDCPSGECCKIISDTSQGTGAVVYKLKIVSCDGGGGGGSGGDIPDDGGGFPDDGGSGDYPDDSGTGGGGGGSGDTGGGTPTDNTDTTCIADAAGNCIGDITSPLVDVALEKECSKISKLFNTNPTFKSKIQTLATKVTDNKEHSLSFHEDGTEHQEEGVVGSGGIDYPEYASKYKAFAHTHDSFGENGEGTLSIFSIRDLIALAKLAHFNKLNSGTFVAFLATNDSTKYALTINNPTKLIDLFYNNIIGNEIPTTFELVQKSTQSYVKVESLFEEYYDKDNPNAKLKVNSTNTANDLKEFLNFINEGDIGVTLFESADNFNTFNKASLKSDGSVDKKSCN